MDIKTGKIFAIKSISKKGLLDAIQRNPDSNTTRAFYINSIQNEIKMLGRFKDQNIIELIDQTEDSKEVFMMTEYCNQGSLQQFIDEEAPLSFEEAMPLFKKIVKTCRKIHRQKVLYRNLRPSGILLNNGEPKFSDFGLAIDMANDSDFMRESASWVKPD